MTPRRILYCIPQLYNSGGMERVLTQKVNWLAAHTDYAITIVTTERTPEGAKDVYFPLDERVRVEHWEIDFDADYDKPLVAKWIGHMRRMRIYRRRLTEFIRTYEVNLCISLCGKEIAFLHTLPCRTIAELHFGKDQRRQLLEATHSGWVWSVLGRIRTWQLVRAVRPLEHLVVLTEADKRAWMEAGCRNTVCIPNVCSLDGQEGLVSSDKKKQVLAVGRLHAQKGFDLLLRAWEPVEQHYPDWSLRIVGEGSQRAVLEQMIRELNLQRVSLSGQSDRMIDEYMQASVFVLSSRYEGLPLALIEAMWSGLPCVAFDCPHGAAELLASERGWLVPNGDVAALTHRLEWVMTHSDEAKERASRAQQYAHSVYSEARIMPQWVELIAHD